MHDGIIVKTENATQIWQEDTRWDGNNHISVATGSQWNHETLYRSRKGRYYTEHDSQWQGWRRRAEWLSKHEAASWLLANNHDLPAELEMIEEEVSE
jgi:hypothetical protein